MGHRRGSAEEFSPGEQFEAFRERAAEVRRHPLFAESVYTTSWQMRWVDTFARWEISMPSASRDQQYQLATLMRPLLAQDDMVSLFKIFKTFGRVCTDGLLQQAMADVRTEYQARQAGTLFARTTPFREGDPPPTWITDRQIGQAVLYGKLLHTNAGHRRLLQSLGDGTDRETDEHQAVMRLFHDTGVTAIQADDLIALAAEQKALKL